jgi:shikimate kinase
MIDPSTIDFLQKRNICLIGFMGSGKSFVGQALAIEFNRKLYDTDTIIENTLDKPIYEIFREKGEKYFRKLEKDFLQDLVYGNSPDKKLISMGGGMPIPRGNRRLMRMLDTFNICLNPPFETLYARIRGTQRPLVYRRTRNAIFNLWSERYKAYQSIAHITIPDVEIADIMRTLNDRVKFFLKG